MHGAWWLLLLRASASVLLFTGATRRWPPNGPSPRQSLEGDRPPSCSVTPRHPCPRRCTSRCVSLLIKTNYLQNSQKNSTDFHCNHPVPVSQLQLRRPWIIKISSCILKKLHITTIDRIYFLTHSETHSDTGCISNGCHFFIQPKLKPNFHRCSAQTFSRLVHSCCQMIIQFPGNSSGPLPPLYLQPYFLYACKWPRHGSLPLIPLLLVIISTNCLISPYMLFVVMYAFEFCSFPI